MQLFSRERIWRRHELKERYDVVIIGAGVHGLATAYYLAKSGVTDIAVLDAGYVGGGNSGRNTAIIRANYRTAEGIPFYQESLKLYEGLSQELGFNILFSQQGHLTLGHTDSAMKGLRERAAANQLLGVDSRIVGRDELARLVPDLDLSATHAFGAAGVGRPTTRPRYPIQGALYHPPGGILRHDAVVWGYARAADRLGVQIHPFTRVTGIDVTNGQVTSVRVASVNGGSQSAIGHRRAERGGHRAHTSAASGSSAIKTETVVNATAGSCSIIARMVGIDLPVTTHPLQACVTERLKPFLDKVIVSSNLHVYVSQTDRGEVVLGEEINPYTSYSQRSTLRFLENVAAHTLELFPCLHNVRILRQWAGICDMTPDYSPIMGWVPRVRGFVLDVGWGTYGFKAGPVSGKRIAELIVTGKTPDLIRPFSITRFAEDRLVGEKAAAAVSH